MLLVILDVFHLRLFGAVCKRNTSRSFFPYLLLRTSPLRPDLVREASAGSLWVVRGLGRVWCFADLCRFACFA